ncbi:helix-turn-helix domain-containing protein [Streptoalloteichus hindustanus]|uniref:AraC-type DNA-binding protein n=1 Tax=Streptoalloteichus hindustanus TaxID=2017 RepID=A0A1M4U0S9_STRHI|nr:AraC family transcriptional regulator [Streptoalloteichus hindustanus]SHE50381.1 AraC-type DNA-binding protein [Streptoalloteichus hindustanus]
MTGPRRDTRGIVDAKGLFARVSFRRVLPAAHLRPYLEHYWLIDGDLDEPYTTHVVPHPSVNLVFENGLPHPVIAGVGLSLFTRTLRGRVRVRGVQFRPGGFRAFRPEPVAEWTGRVVPRTTVDAGRVLDADDPVAALDAVLGDPRPDPQVDLAMDLVARIRSDRGVLRVADFARDVGVPVRTLQRLFAGYVGVSPKWVILRYRVHEALERAGGDVDWARTAAELGYSDQSHLVRDFTRTVGISPTAYSSGVATSAASGS